jgi:REP element-mobilizing transposase RayT
VYFITCCTVDRRAILHRAAFQQAFEDFCRRAVDYGVHVGRFVIMPDHVHLFAALRDEACSLSIWVKSLKNTLSKSLREMGTPGPHWQKGFFDHLLRSHDSYDQKWEYVIANPVRAGLVSRSVDWPFQGVINDLSVSDARRS